MQTLLTDSKEGKEADKSSDQQLLLAQGVHPMHEETVNQEGDDGLPCGQPMLDETAVEHVP